MALETGVTYIEDLVATNPVGATDNVDEGDDHIRNTKTAVKGSFPNLGATAVTKTAAEINDLATITGSETLTNKTLTSPVINTGVSGTAILDEDDLSTDSDTQLATQQSIKAYVDTKIASLNTKILTIGDWNMDSSVSTNITHSIADFKKMRSINVIIRDDTDSSYYDFAAIDFTETGNAHAVLANATTIVLNRGTGGIFDSVGFNSTSYNRGWVTIQYTD